MRLPPFGVPKPVHKVIAGSRPVFGRTGAVGVAAGGDVVKAGLVAGAFCNGVKSRIGKADRGLAVVGRLLVRQRDQSRPERGGQAGAHFRQRK